MVLWKTVTGDTCWVRPTTPATSTPLDTQCATSAASAATSTWGKSFATRPNWPRAGSKSSKNTNPAMPADKVIWALLKNLLTVGMPSG